MKVFIEETFNEDGTKRGDLYLESDSMQFILREYNGKLDGKGNEQSKNIGYYTDVKSALLKLIKLKVMQSTASTLQELHDDIRRIEQAVCMEFNWSAVELAREAAANE